MENPSLLQITADLLITKWFRWLVIILTIMLLVYSYVQDPVRFSDKKQAFGIDYKLKNFIIIIIVLNTMFATFIGLWYTIPFSQGFPDMWYIPFMVIIFAYVTQLYINTAPAVKDDKSLNAPPSYLLPRRYRLIIAAALIVLSAVAFTQNLIYAGTSTQFKTTILHQFFLNRFGGASPENVFKFIASWLGIISTAVHIYKWYDVKTFSACNYNLPVSWNF